MRSTIKIDIDQNNNPIILICYTESDDLRDKMVKRFLDRFEHSPYGEFYRHNHFPSEGSITVEVTPIPISELKGHMIHIESLTTGPMKTESIPIAESVMNVGELKRIIADKPDDTGLFIAKRFSDIHYRPVQSVTEKPMVFLENTNDKIANETLFGHVLVFEEE